MTSKVSKDDMNGEERHTQEWVFGHTFVGKEEDLLVGMTSTYFKPLNSKAHNTRLAPFSRYFIICVQDVSLQ